MRAFSAATQAIDRSEWMSSSQALGSGTAGSMDGSAGGWANAGGAAARRAATAANRTGRKVNSESNAKDR